MRSYDLVYIVKTDLDNEAISAIVERVTQRLKEQGATIEHAEVWGKRRMAFPIKRYREGHYVFVRFSAPGDRIPEIRHNLKIVEDVLRASIVVAVGAIAPPKTAAQPAPSAPPTATVAQPAPSAPPAATAPQPEAPQSDTSQVQGT
ncbi:MAG TPA: 30S ribosomal protein S6 [bacterium]|nr:30S ribosomal protein S6 [bacterium]